MGSHFISLKTFYKSFISLIRHGRLLVSDSWVAVGSEEITEEVPLWECRGGAVLLVNVYLVYEWGCVAMSL